MAVVLEVAGFRVGFPRACKSDVNDAEGLAWLALTGQRRSLENGVRALRVEASGLEKRIKAVIGHRIWLSGDEFRWTKEAAA